MDRSDRPPGRGVADTPGEERPAPALADADAILARADDDAAAADEARARVRREGLPDLAPDERIAPLLEPGERLVAHHHGALLERRAPAPGARLTPGVAGELYLTTRRLVLVGRLTLWFELPAIEDAVVSGERLLLVLRGGQGIALQVAQPRRLGVELAAARGAAGAAQASGVDTPPRPDAR